MKITKRQLRRIIKEERSRILKEYSGDGPDRIEEIMAEMNELNNGANKTQMEILKIMAKKMMQQLNIQKK